MKTHLKAFLLSLTSAILLSIAWQPVGIWFTLFTGFIPLLFLHRNLVREQKEVWFFPYVYVSFLIWNVATTFWVWNASPEGSIAAFVLNALLMCLPWVLMQRFYKRLGEYKAYSFLVFGWITFEWLHLNWEASWPWLTLGNVFSNATWAVQWYEYTGHLGGSIWIWFVNIRLYRIMRDWKEMAPAIRYNRIFNFAFVWLFAPLLLSWYIGSNYASKAYPIRTMVVQPNIDPYRDKFGRMTPEEQAQKMLQLAESKMDSSIELICFPETALVGGINEGEWKNEPLLQLVFLFKQKFPHVKILSGGDTYKLFGLTDKIPLTARQYNQEIFYDSYNTALFFNAHDSLSFYHKSKLVPGVEKMPYPQLFGFLEKLTIDLGGTSGSLGSDPEPKVFALDRFYNIAPVICYESVYGNYVAQYVQKGANLICIITNDGWWGNTPGYRQHFDFGRLRAIENRRFIARAANTGISGFIDDKGNIMSQSEWWKEDVLTGTVNLNTYETFYTKYGDYIGLICAVFWFFRLLSNIQRRPEI